MPNRPHFDTIEMKGGGDAVSAARAVIQTGEYDFAWNIQVEDEVLLRLENGGKGKTVYAVGSDIETIFLNLSDPNTEVDGERSSIKTKNPLLSDPAVRRALSMLVDRNAIQKFIYGRAGRTTANFFNGLPTICLQEHVLGGSTSERQPRCWKRPAGSLALTAFARRTERS
jgi:peptide/nickel transport system substrate-binding protein